MHISGTYDYFGLNYYTSDYAIPYDGSGEPASDQKDHGYYQEKDPSWPGSASSWLKVSFLAQDPQIAQYHQFQNTNYMVL